MLLPWCVLIALTSSSTPVELPLWPDGVPGAPESPGEEVLWGDAPDRHVRDVHVPTLEVFQPEPDSNSGCAVVICPGGGYGVLAIDKEGYEVARWFAQRGVTGVVLKYRLPRPAGHVYGHDAPLADVRRALALVREHAQEWAVDPDKVGVMGFSAGGHLAASASVLIPDEVGPDFTILAYAVVSMRAEVGHAGSRRNLLGSEPSEDLLQRYSCDEQVSATTPPAFLVHTSDDGVKVQNSLRYYAALRAAQVPAAMHIFERGGHGYGLRQRGMPVDHWPELLLAWMDGRGLLSGR